MSEAHAMQHDDAEAEAPFDPIIHASETMIGDLVMLVRDECQALRRPWDELPPNEQQAYFDRWESRVTRAVQQAVFKDGDVRIVLQARNGTGAHDLADCTDRSVLVTIPEDVEYAYGGGVPGKQIGLPLS